jgi:glycosyltransferase involved in cell wall biosynthesis
VRVTVVTCVFPPEPVVSARTSHDVASELARRGHDVTVIAPYPSRPAGKLYTGYRRSLIRREQTGSAYQLIRCFSCLSAKSTIFSRFLENISFGLTSAFALLGRKKPNAIYANTWPIFAAGFVVAIARLRSIPVVLSIQDVYPESLISQRRLPEGHWVARCLTWFDRLVASSSSHLIVLSHSFAALYVESRGIPADRTHVVANWIETRGRMSFDGTCKLLKQRLNIPDDGLLAVYGGNVGTAAGVETLVESFRYLADFPGVYLLIAGEGASLDRCRTLAQTAATERIFFLTPWREEEDISMVLAAADLFLLPTRGEQSTVSVPSKLLAYLMAAKPIIAMARSDSELHRLMEQSNAGWTIEPDNPQLLAAKIKEYVRMDLSERRRLGESGRQYLMQHLTREVCLPRVITIMESAASEKPAYT